MKNAFLLFFAISLFALSCGENDTISPKTTENDKLQLLPESNGEWTYKNFRVIPIVASAAASADAVHLSHVKSLKQGMEIMGFRITELKQFGRTKEQMVNSLTITNKSQDTIFIMGGDVVKGGNQDRVIAYDQIVPPNTVKNTEVFCVESGRWNYEETANENEKQVCAFKGYYNVAAPKIRNTVYAKGGQQDVWSAVGKVTKANNAESDTHSYTALDKESTEKSERDQLLKHFEGKLVNRNDVVGMIVVSGDEILGFDVFGHNNLFKSNFMPLLHGYSAEMAICKSEASQNEAKINKEFSQILKTYEQKKASDEAVGLYNFEGLPLHIYKKKLEE